MDMKQGWGHSAACLVVVMSRPVVVAVEGWAHGTTRWQELRGQRCGAEKAHRGGVEGSGWESGKDRGAVLTQLPQPTHSRFTQICPSTLESRALSVSLTRKQIPLGPRLRILLREKQPYQNFMKKCAPLASY